MGAFTYYDYRKLYSLNCTFNLVIGARGIGKTYGCKRDGIKDALKDGSEFIYLRRFDEDLKDAKMTFFDDVMHEFPEWEFRVNGRIAEAATLASAGDKKRNWKRIGFFVALSVAQSKKSVSYHNVKRIIFDEFIAEKGTRYLPDEARAFMNFFSTVARTRTNVRAYLLANAVSIANPYFVRWKVEVPKTIEIVRKFKDQKTGRYFMAIHFPKAEEFQSQVAETEFGRFMLEADPEFAAFAMKNEFADNSEALIKRKDPQAAYRWTLETNSGSIAMWYSPISKLWYATDELPPIENQKIFTIEPRYQREGVPLLTLTDPLMSRMRTAWRRDKVRFRNAAGKAAFLETFG